MKGKHFAIFGLGDSSYELYNEMGKHFDASFEKLGGIRAHELGAGNAETHSTEEDFHNWSAPLWEKLIAIYNDIAPSAEQSQPRAKVVKSDPSVMAYRAVAADSNDALPVDADVAYDLNARNYMKAWECPISSIRELR